MKFLFLLSLLVSSGGWLFAGGLTMPLTRVREFGGNGPVIGYVQAVTEDRNGNLHVLDGNSCTIHMFSATGRHIRTYGKKGQGPGDLAQPNDIACNEAGEIVVCENGGVVSIFGADGRFLRRIPLKKSLGYIADMKYAGGGLFYGERSDAEGRRFTQIVFDEKGKIRSWPLFSRPNDTIRKQSGERTIGFSLFDPAYSPRHFFHHCGGFRAAAYSREYTVRIVKSDGTLLTRIGDGRPAAPFTAAERQRINADIRSMSWPDEVKKALADAVPERGNLFTGLWLTDRWLLVFLSSPAADGKKTGQSLDVYTREGRLLGRTNLALAQAPVFVSPRFLYVVEEGEDDLKLVQYAYTIPTGGK